jgi:hypothetical protein
MDSLTFHRSTKSMFSTPLHSGSLPSINQLNTAGYTSTFRRDKCSISSPSITITGNQYQVCLRSPLQEGARGREKEHHRAHISRYHQSRTPPRLPQAHSTPLPKCSMHLTSMSTCHQISTAHSEVSHILRIMTEAALSSPHSSYCPTISH